MTIKRFDIFEENMPSELEIQILNKAESYLQENKKLSTNSRRWFLFIPPTLVAAGFLGFFLNKFSKNENQNISQALLLDFLDRDLDATSIELLAEIDEFDALEYIEDIEEKDWEDV